MTDQSASTGDMGRFARKLTDQELHQILGGQAPDEEGELQQLASFVRDARAVLGQASDEETAAQHLAAMRDMAQEADTAVITSTGPAPWRRVPSSQRDRSRVMSRKLLAIVSVVVLVGLLSGAAYAGVLPRPVLSAFSQVANTFGIMFQVATPEVTVLATDGGAAEAAADPGTFTISRSGDTAGAMTVNYALTGTAGNGSDYALLSSMVVIPATQASVTVAVTPLNDDLPEDDENVILALVSGTGYNVGTPSVAIVTIDDNDPPSVSVVASDAAAAESGPDSGTFTISRTGPTTNPLLVSYTLTGTAGNGIDYSSLTTTVLIAAGQPSASVTVTPINDTVSEPLETVILTIAVNTLYAVGSPSAATVNISAALLPGTMPTSKDQCKNGGWQTFGVFKNQGDCVSWVATGGMNPPAGTTPPPGTMPTNKDQCKNGGWQTFGVFKNQGDCVSWVATAGRNPPAGGPR